MMSMLPDGGRRKLECLVLIDLRCWSAMSLLMFIILTATGVGPAVDHSGVAPPGVPNPWTIDPLGRTGPESLLGVNERTSSNQPSDNTSGQGCILSYHWSQQTTHLVPMSHNALSPMTAHACGRLAYQMLSHWQIFEQQAKSSDQRHESLIFC